MPTTTISAEVSLTTASWLEQEARTRGADVGKIAASILEERARTSVPRPKDAAQLTPDERLQAFREFTRQLKPGPGSHGDDSRESIYED